MKTYFVIQEGRREPWILNAINSGAAFMQVLSLLQASHGDDFHLPRLEVRSSA